MKKNNKKGFTLVELVIVVAVMAILVAIAIPTVSSITSKATDAVAKTNCQTIQSMIKLKEANLANDSATGAVTLTADNIDSALTEAKLGISGTFTYDPTTGVVTTAAATAGQFEIVLDAEATTEDGIVVVTAK